MTFQGTKKLFPKKRVWFYQGVCCVFSGGGSNFFIEITISFGGGGGLKILSGEVIAFFLSVFRGFKVFHA